MGEEGRAAEWADTSGDEVTEILYGLNNREKKGMATADVQWGKSRLMNRGGRAQNGASAIITDVVSTKLQHINLKDKICLFLKSKYLQRCSGLFLTSLTFNSSTRSNSNKRRFGV